MDQAITLSLPTTPDEFLVWEVLQEEKHEFDGHAPVHVNGGTREHAILERNIVAELVGRLRGSACQVFGSTMKVQIGPAWRYPDASVSCTPIERGAILVPAPVVLFEVVSPGSEVRDRRTKLREYRSLSSLQQYVLLEQDECAATVYTRMDGGWRVDTLGDSDILDMPTVGASVPVAAFYQDVFPQS